MSSATKKQPRIKNMVYNKDNQRAKLNMQFQSSQKFDLGKQRIQLINDLNVGSRYRQGKKIQKRFSKIMTWNEFAIIAKIAEKMTTTQRGEWKHHKLNSAKKTYSEDNYQC